MMVYFVRAKSVFWTCLTNTYNIACEKRKAILRIMVSKWLIMFIVSGYDVFCTQNKHCLM